MLRAAATLVLASVLVACATSSSTQAQGSGCATTGRQLASKDNITVVKAADQVVACDGTREVVLATGPFEKIFESTAIAIRGTRVAYGFTLNEDPNDDVGGTELRVLNFATPTDELNPRRLDAGPEDVAKVVTIRLAANGALAWTSCRTTTIPPQTRNGPGTRCYRRGQQAWLYAAAKTGDSRLRDSGKTLTASSLRLSGRTYTWTKNGKRRTARLP